MKETEIIRRCVNCHDRIKLSDRIWESIEVKPYPCALKKHVPIEDGGENDAQR